MSRNATLVLVVVAAVILGVTFWTNRGSGPGPSKVAREAGAMTISYDESEEPIAERVGELWLPAGDGPHPVVIVIHGGFWRTGFNRDLMDALSQDLASKGYAAWNIEYRVVGAGGGWPQTFEDVALAVDHVAEMATTHQLDLERVATVGHSAGGHLALWAASRHQIEDGLPGADPQVRAKLAVSQAGVVDLVDGVRADLGGGAVRNLMGATPDDEPERYRNASPIELLPSGVPSVLVHGRQDQLVPLSQSERYQARANEAGDSSELQAYEGDHFEHLDPKSEAWRSVLRALEAIR